MVAKGQAAPDFTLVDSNKNPVTLSALKGKNVVLAFFPAAFTGVSEKEMCTFRDSMSAFNDLAASVYGISVDGPFSQKAFSDRNGLTFPLLSDYTREAVKAYGITHDDFAGLKGYTAAKRSVFVVDKTGVVQYVWVA